MKSNLLMAGMVGMALLVGTADGFAAANWVVNDADKPNKNVERNYYDAQSVKVRKKTLSWTEKTVLTDFGVKYYARHLTQYPVCQKNMAEKGEVAYHQIDLQIRNGKFRTIAKRNYNKADELLCTDKDMGNEFDKSWQDIVYGSPIYERHYLFVTKYKLGDDFSRAGKR